MAFIENAKKFSSIGKNVANCYARLVDITTQQDISTAGQTGELWLKGPHIMKGYLNDEAATKNTLTEDGWLKTGDIAYFDEDFDFYITDRLKELIKVKGFQVTTCSDRKKSFSLFILMDLFYFILFQFMSIINLIRRDDLNKNIFLVISIDI